MPAAECKRESIAESRSDSADPASRLPMDSEQLFQGANEVVIRHNGREYRLRRTRLGKLILTA